VCTSLAPLHVCLPPSLLHTPPSSSDPCRSVPQLAGNVSFFFFSRLGNVLFFPPMTFTYSPPCFFSGLRNVPKLCLTRFLSFDPTFPLSPRIRRNPLTTILASATPPPGSTENEGTFRPSLPERTPCVTAVPSPSFEFPPFCAKPTLHHVLYLPLLLGFPPRRALSVSVQLAGTRLWATVSSLSEDDITPSPPPPHAVFRLMCTSRRLARARAPLIFSTTGGFFPMKTFGDIVSFCTRHSSPSHHSTTLSAARPTVAIIERYGPQAAHNVFPPPLPSLSFLIVSSFPFFFFFRGRL